MAETKIDQAKQVLADNYHGDHTIPAKGLYPHQWLWDSCFVAIGLSNYDLPKAQQEILSLLRGQWANGMVPNMIFDMGFRYRQDRELWRSYTSPYAPEGIATSGITQPPLIAEAVVRIGKKLPKIERLAWYRKVYPHLVAYHKWLYRDRDPKNEGLVLLVHPWESGLDSSPPWMFELEQYHMAFWIKLVKWLKLDHLVNRFRRDTRFVPPGQRLNTIDALLVYNLLRRLRHKGYSNQRVLQSKLPKIEDVGFNAIFIRANSHLKTIAKAIGRELPQSLVTDMKHTEQAFEELWDDTQHHYFSYNINRGDMMRVPTIAGLLALYSGTIKQERAEQLVKHLKDRRTFHAAFPVPSVPIDAPWFQQHRYWQGPTWINTNWLIADGLDRLGYTDEAAEIIATSKQLVEKTDFHEYYSPLDGSPAGAKQFSWTAALYIDMCNRK